MKTIIRPLARIACAGLLMLHTLAVQAEILQPGQLLTFVLSENKANAEAVREKYFAFAFPAAATAGMKELTTFKPVKLLSEDNPDGSGLYLWPSKAAANSIRTNPVYLKDYKPLRGQAWNQLQSIDMDIKAPLELNLDKSKTYSVALLWLKDASAYGHYYQGTQALRDQLGAKTLLKLPGSRYDLLTQGEITPPDLVVLVQWNSAEDLSSYSTQPDFQANHHFFEQGVKAMKLYRLGFWD